MFEEILRENPPREDYRPGDHAVAMVRFGLHGGLYCYNCPDIIYRPGDLAVVRVRGEETVVTIESVGFYSKGEYPFHGVYMRSIEGPAEGDLAEKYREAIEKTGSITGMDYSSLFSMAGIDIAKLIVILYVDKVYLVALSGHIAVKVDFVLFVALYNPVGQ